MSSGEIRVVGSFQVTDGNKLMEAAKTVMDLTRKEKGCIQYELHQDIDDPTKYAFIEAWESLNDLEAHLQTEHLKAFVAIVLSIKGDDDIVIKKYKSCGH